MGTCASAESAVFVEFSGRFGRLFVRDLFFAIFFEFALTGCRVLSKCLDFCQSEQHLAASVTALSLNTIFHRINQVRIEAMDAFYLSQLAIAICLGVQSQVDRYIEKLSKSPARTVADAIRRKDESDPIAKSYLRWAKGQ